jgi:hypothetical protein
MNKDRLLTFSILFSLLASGFVGYSLAWKTQPARVQPAPPSRLVTVPSELPAQILSQPVVALSSRKESSASRPIKHTNFVDQNRNPIQSQNLQADINSHVAPQVREMPRPGSAVAFNSASAKQEQNSGAQPLYPTPGTALSRSDSNRPYSNIVQSDSGEIAIVAPDEHASIPLALSDPSPSSKLNDQQVAGWNKLRQDFADSLAGSNQNPNDPNNQSNWRAAQEANDQLFMQKFGWQAFVQQQLEALHQAGDSAQ